MRSTVLRFKPSVIFSFFAILLCAMILLTGFPVKMVDAITQKRLLPIYCVETGKAQVSLGINCAWGDEDVEAILKVLKENEIKASFFVTGTFCRKYPSAVKAMYDAGHEIGSHSNTHVDLTKLGHSELMEQIQRCNDEIMAITGEKPYLFRTPSGSYSNTVIEAIKNEGMAPIQWDCDSVDYKDPTVGQMKERIMKKLGNGSIMLFHVGAKNTPQALPEIIKAIKDKGYSFVTVGELILPEPYKLDHEGRQSPA